MTTKNLKICFIGDFGVGKTSLLKAYLEEDTISNSNVQTTLGIDFFSKTVVAGGANVRLRIWDTAGTERYRSLMHSYLRDSSIVVVVYDLTNSRSMEHVKSWMVELESHRPLVVAVVGNKTDLETQGTHDVQKSVEPWQCRERKTVFARTTARRKEPIETLMKKCVRLALNDAEVLDHQPVSIETNKIPVSGTCCA